MKLPDQLSNETAQKGNNLNILIFLSRLQLHFLNR